MNSEDIQRYIALDIHKEYVMVGAMNAAQEWVIRPRRIEMTQFRYQLIVVEGSSAAAVGLACVGPGMFMAGGKRS